MPYQFVHTADWHIGKILNDYSMLEEQCCWFEQFIARLAELRPDALIIAGDMYDRSVPSADAVALLNDILRRIVLDLHIETFLIAGNHDSGERLSFGGALLEQGGLHIAGPATQDIKKVAVHTKEQTVNVYLLPYMEPHNIKRFYPSCAIHTQEDAVLLHTKQMLNTLNCSDRNILVAHGLFSLLQETGASRDQNVGGSDLVNAASFQAFDYVALGHLHSHCSAGSSRMIYSGSPLKYSIDEAKHQKGFCVVRLEESGGISSTFESLSPRRDVRVLEGGFEWLADRRNHTHLEDYVFANITDRTVTLNAISRLKAVFPNILGLRYVNLPSASADRLSENRETLRRLTPPKLFADFYQNVMGSEMDQEQCRLVEEAFAAVAPSNGYTDFPDTKN